LARTLVLGAIVALGLAVTAAGTATLREVPADAAGSTIDQKGTVRMRIGLR
jgi:hypothetical protein